MGILDRLLGRKPCMICGGSVKETDASKIMVASRDATSASSNYGKKCNKCDAFVHYRCSKLSAKRERGQTVKQGDCLKCGETLLILITR